MPISPVYKKASEAAIASYSYTDIAEGTGVVVFNGFKTTPSPYYKLGTNPPYSEEISTLNGTDTPTVMDFDLTPFNLPKIVRGTAYVSLGIGKAETGSVSVTCQVYKVSAATTAISSARVSKVVVSASSPEMSLVNIPLTQTHFKIGDILRLKMTLTNAGWTGGGDYGELGHDPAGRDGTYITGTNVTTQLKFYCPFRIDL